MDIKEKIAQLRKVVTENGATEAEMLTALSIADKLMKKHGISEADLKNVEYARDMKEGSFTQKQKAIHPSQKFCAVTIGRFCSVRIWQSWMTQKKQHISMFGFNGDVEMAEFLMELIHNAMDRGWKEFLAENGPDPSVSRHTQYWNYMMAFGDRINERLRELMEDDEIVADSTGSDLIATKDAIVDAGLEAMLPSLNLRTTKGRGINADPDSWSKGKAAGDKVNLSRPINQGPTGGRKLLT